MSRPETPIDPNAPEPVRRLAEQLREARTRARTSYREMGPRVNYSPSALSTAASGKKMPSLDVTLAYIKSLQSEHEDPAEWEQRWKQAKKDLEVIRSIPVSVLPTSRYADAVAEVRLGDQPMAFRLRGFGTIRTQGDWSRAMRWLLARSRFSTWADLAQHTPVDRPLLREVFTGERMLPSVVVREVLEALGAHGEERAVLLNAADYLRRVQRGARAMDATTNRHVVVHEAPARQIVEQPPANGRPAAAASTTEEGGELYALLHRLIRTPEFWALAQKVILTVLVLTGMLIWLLVK